jgi:hypothetical protein
MFFLKKEYQMYFNKIFSLFISLSLLCFANTAYAMTQEEKGNLGACMSAGIFISTMYKKQPKLMETVVKQLGVQEYKTLMNAAMRAMKRIKNLSGSDLTTTRTQIQVNTKIYIETMKIGGTTALALLLVALQTHHKFCKDAPDRWGWPL